MTTFVDRKAHIGESLFTIGWLEETLQKELKTKASFVSYIDERIGLSQGFLSLILKVEISWSDQDETRPTRFVVKAPTAEVLKNALKPEKPQSEVDGEVAEQAKKTAEKPGVHWVALMHNTEVEMYNIISGFDVQLAVPFCYHACRFEDEKPGALILEDLSDRGLVKTLTDGLTVESVLNVMEAFAKLHAWCFDNRQKWHNNLRLNMTHVTFASNVGFNMVQKMNEMTADYVPVDFPGVLDETIQRCREAKIILGYTEEQVKIPQKVNSVLGMPDVLVHGDLWISNLVFEKDKEGKGTDTVLKILDWQVAHSGCFAEDLARLLLTSCTAAVRRENTERFIRHYFDTLTKLMGRQPPFTLEQLTQAYKKVFLFATFNLFPMLPMFAKRNRTNPEEAKKELPQRTKAVLEDCLAIQKELNG